METKHYAVVVIGGGTAGANAARAAVRAGARSVALIRNPKMSNTCVAEGCMPSKAVLAAAAQGLPFAQSVAHGHAVSERLDAHLTTSLENAPYDVLWGTARFSDNQILTLESSDTTHVVRAERFVIATGSQPFIPAIPGLRELPPSKMILSHDVVGLRASLETKPERLIVLGSGAIGLELATFFHRLGSDVRIVERAPRILPFLDPAFSDERLRIASLGHGFDISTKTELTKIEETESGVCATLSLEGGSTRHDADAILVATGRTPDIDGLEIERAGLTPEDGHIPHDRSTLVADTNPSVFIAGDVTGHHEILHYARQMGKIAGTNAALDKPTAQMHYDAHALSVVFEEYESASIGLSEHEASGRSISCSARTYQLTEIGRGITDRLPGGLMKLIAEKESGRILGGGMLGPHAGEVIQFLAPFIAGGRTVSDIAATPLYHPTYTELWGSLAREILEEDGVVRSA